jgi:exopolysaccharide biosynthesis operon protein EpsL
MRFARLAPLALACLPMAAAAYPTTDQIMWPAQGIYPAYPQEARSGPIRAFVSGGLYHDSNLFRLSDGANTQALLGTSQRSDDIRQLGAGLEADWHVSEQRLRLDARGDDYRYDRFGFLDHSAYQADGTWQWRAGPLWSGDVGYARRRFLAGFGEQQAPVKNMITVAHSYASAGRMLSPRWRLRGGLDHYAYDYGNPAAMSAVAVDHTSSVTLGGDYVTPRQNSIGAQAKLTDGRYLDAPGLGGSDTEFRETEVSGVASWRVSGKSRFEGRLGYTDRHHDQLSQRDFHGVTGRLDYDWIAGAKTVLNFAAWRDLEAVENNLANYALSEGLSFGPHWAPTLRTVVQARAFRVKRSYYSNSALTTPGAPEQEDTARGENLSFGYTPRNFLRLSLGLEHGTQSSNVPASDYSYDLVSANAWFRF